MVADLAMRWRIQDGLIPREAINAYIKEATHYPTQDSKANETKHFHKCSLWLPGKQVVNISITNFVV
jgi:hypothetical protein